jgi:hypothetical protein
MTAGMTTRKLEGSRVSLPRAGLGGLLAATLLAGSLIGAAAYAGIGAATAQPAAVTTTLAHGLAPDARDSFRYSRPLSVTQPHDSSIARDGFGANLPIGAPSFTQQRGRFDLR